MVRYQGECGVLWGHTVGTQAIVVNLEAPAPEEGPSQRLAPAFPVTGPRSKLSFASHQGWLNID